jgi:hypothetical protein
VDGPLTAAALTVDASQFANLLAAGHPLLALNDTIVIDAPGISPLAPVNLGTLVDFGGNDAFGMILGGAQNGSFSVNLGSSGVAAVTMSGLGQQQISGATGPRESFIVAGDSIGGSTILNLESSELIDVTNASFGDPKKDPTRVDFGSQVIGSGQWAFEAGNHTLTWWDDGHNAAETLTLQFAAGVTQDLTIKNAHTFQVV